MTDFHLRQLAKAQQQLRFARADLASYAETVNRSDPRAVQHLAKLKRGVRYAEVEVASAERSLAGLQAMCRKVAEESM